MPTKSDLFGHYELPEIMSYEQQIIEEQGRRICDANQIIKNQERLIANLEEIIRLKDALLAGTDKLIDHLNARLDIEEAIDESHEEKIVIH